MAFERIVEEIIREAIERGEFKDLAGKGGPIDLTAYFRAPEDSRVAQALLRMQGSPHARWSSCRRSGTLVKGRRLRKTPNPSGHCRSRSRADSWNLISGRSGIGVVRTRAEAVPSRAARTTRS